MSQNQDNGPGPTGPIESGPEQISPSPNREPSFGEKAVGLSFNPGGDPEVYTCKSAYAHIIDMLNAIRSRTESAEQKRLCSAAITEAQGAQMWAVKAITWKD